jgi:UDP-2,3-diacylglucosamine pyrophosphatase LpxH
VFDKKAITEAFIDFCGRSKPGDAVEYWKQDKKWFYNPMLTVENQNGELKRLIIKGERCYYSKFNPQTLINQL